MKPYLSPTSASVRLIRHILRKKISKIFLPACCLLCTHPSTYPSIQTQYLLKAYYAPGPRLASRAPSQMTALKPVNHKLKYRFFFFKYILPTLILGGKNSSKLMEYGKLHKSINNYVIQVF